MLERTQVPFCTLVYTLSNLQKLTTSRSGRLGYDRLFAETIGEQLPIDCDAVRAETGPPKPS